MLRKTGAKEPVRPAERDHRALDIIQDLAEMDEFHFDMVLEQSSPTTSWSIREPSSRTMRTQAVSAFLRLWLSIPDARSLSEGLRDAYKAVEFNTIRGGFKAQIVTPELWAYQARAAAALGMRDTRY